MKVSIKCHDCKQRYTADIDDSGIVPEYKPMLCQFCWSDALFAEPVYWLDRNPRVKFAAQLFVLAMVGFAAAAVLFALYARCGG